MTLPKRTLTLTFDRSITAGKPDTVEVSVVPLAEPEAQAPDTLLIGGPQTKTLLLANQTNSLTFQLVPTDHPQLQERVLYRIGWRQRYLGRQTTHDFVMPDTDINFADLADLGNILGGETYVQWTDRGAPGGVAALNSLGQVVDASGTPIISDDGDNLASSLTASGGIQKTTTPATETTPAVHDFSLQPGAAGRKWSGDVTPASGNFGTITHGLGTTDILAAVYRISDRMPIEAVIHPNADGNTVSIQFSSPPGPGQYRAVIIG